MKLHIKSFRRGKSKVILFYFWAKGINLLVMTKKLYSRMGEKIVTVFFFFNFKMKFEELKVNF